MARYQIWNKIDKIYTPGGPVFTPEEWINQNKWMESPTAVPVVWNGVLNGSFVGELSEMKTLYEQQGADFSSCETNEEILTAIEAFEDKMNTPDPTPSAQERIAAALEYQNLLSM